MAVYGYNPEELNLCLTNLQSCYSKIYTALSVTFKTQIVDPMSVAWYGEDAVKFFGSDSGEDSTNGESTANGEGESTGNSVKEVVDGFLNDINTVFTSLIDTLVANGKNEQMEIGDTIFNSAFALDLKTLKLNVSSISSSIEGVRKKDTDAMSTAASYFATISDTVDTELTNAINYTESSGFINETEVSNLASQMATLKTNISNALAKLKTDFESCITAETSDAESVSTQNQSNLGGSEQ